MYVSPNYKSLKAIKEALAARTPVYVYQPNAMDMNRNVPDGEVDLEGPHFPEPHKWYAEGQVRQGRLVSIK